MICIFTIYRTFSVRLCMIILYEIISTSFLPGIKWHLQELYYFLPTTIQLIIEIVHSSCSCIFSGFHVSSMSAWDSQWKTKTILQILSQAGLTGNQKTKSQGNLFFRLEDLKRGTYNVIIETLNKDKFSSGSGIQELFLGRSVIFRDELVLGLRI